MCAECRGQKSNSLLQSPLVFAAETTDGRGTVRAWQSNGAASKALREAAEDCRENKNTGVGAAAVLHSARLPENAGEPVTCEGVGCATRDSRPLTEHTFEHQKRISYVHENGLACAAAHAV